MDRCRVFCVEKYEKMIEDGDDHIVYLGTYHTKRGSQPQGDFEKLIWKLKDRNVAAVKYFVDILDQVIERDVIICVVPPHKAGIHNGSGIAIVCHRLAERGRVDAVDALIRLKTVEKLSSGGQREQSVHYDSISYDPTYNMDGKTVVLIDDVTTSGNSLIACRNILMKKTGASRYIMVALGQTDRSSYPKSWFDPNGRYYIEDRGFSDIKMRSASELVIEELIRRQEKHGPFESDCYPGKHKHFYNPYTEDPVVAGSYAEYRLRWLEREYDNLYFSMVFCGELENHLAYVQQQAIELCEHYMEEYFLHNQHWFKDVTAEEYLLQCMQLKDFIDDTRVLCILEQYYGGDVWIQSGLGKWMAKGLPYGNLPA